MKRRPRGRNKKGQGGELHSPLEATRGERYTWSAPPAVARGRTTRLGVAGFCATTQRHPATVGAFVGSRLRGCRVVLDDAVVEVRAPLCQAQVLDLMCRFIEECVLCATCGSPDTSVLFRGPEDVQQTCAACGKVRAAGGDGAWYAREPVCGGGGVRLGGPAADAARLAEEAYDNEARKKAQRRLKRRKARLAQESGEEKKALPPAAAEAAATDHAPVDAATVRAEQ